MTQKGEIVDRLQAKATSIGKILANIEKKYKQEDDDDLAARMKKSPSNLSTREKRASLRIAEIPAFNPKTIKKSPMTEAQPSTSSAAAEEEATTPAQVEATITLSVDPEENKDDGQADPAE